MKLALITGGSKGLGKGLVDIYLENGWEVREFSRSGDSSSHISCDFSDAIKSVTVLNNVFLNLSTEPWSEIVLINNAGMLHPIGPINMYKPSDWQTNLQVNINACVMTTGLFIQHFGELAVPKQIANISSGASTSAYYGWSLYCAAKAAMESFAECVAIEQKQCANPATTYIVIPGVIDTQMQDQIRAQDEQQFPQLNKFLQLKLDNKLQPPEKVAQAIYEITHSSPQGGGKYDVQDFF
jgi:benzil reductase ((S)-benzoin forming)